MKKIGLIIILVFYLAPVWSQVTRSSVLLDKTNKEPVAFANIGIAGKGLGTVSDENGKFSLVIPDSLKNEDIRISMIGYQSLVIKADQNLQTTIFMQPQHQALKEVDVTVKKVKVKILGNDTKTKTVTAGFSKNNLGAELATHLKIKHKGTQLTQFMLNITANSLSVTPIFRINVYAPDKNGRPGENILKQNIIAEAKEMVGLMEVDLKPYNIVVDDDVFVSVEWIKDLGDATNLFFSSKLIGSDTYYKQTSQDKWEKIPSIGVGLHVKAMY